MSIHDMANRTPKDKLWERIIMKKSGKFAPTTWFTQETSIVENPGPLQELWNK
jgi:hypothetical protein